MPLVLKSATNNVVPAGLIHIPNGLVNPELITVLTTAPGTVIERTRVLPVSTRYITVPEGLIHMERALLNDAPVPVPSVLPCAPLPAKTEATPPGNVILRIVFP